MPAGLRGREVNNSTVDVWISNNGPCRRLCSCILPHWPLAWISLIQTIHTLSCAEGQPLSVQLSSLVDIMTPLIHKNDSLMPPSPVIFNMGEDLLDVAPSVAVSGPNRENEYPREAVCVTNTLSAISRSAASHRSGGSTLYERTKVCEHIWA